MRIAMDGYTMHVVASDVISYTGELRVYFNRATADPMIWCVSPDGGGWELAVASVTLDGVKATTVYRPKATPDEEDGRPGGWIAVTGRLTVNADGTARIEAT